MIESLELTPIGIIHTPFAERLEAPRQAAAARGVAARIDLFPDRNFEHALSDLDGFSHIWLLFWFHENPGWRPKVLPPRSTERRGVFATRAPHRPNPIGMSLVELERIDGLTLHVRNVDILDGTPLLDIKPYIPYADCAPHAQTGWLGAEGSGTAPADPSPAYAVAFEPLAAEQLAFLADKHGVDLKSKLEHVLALGPEPHPYRRIRRTADGFRLALKDWRAAFKVEGRQVTVIAITSGYRPRQLALDEGPALDIHRAFVAAYGQ